MEIIYPCYSQFWILLFSPCTWIYYKWIDWGGDINDDECGFRSILQLNCILIKVIFQMSTVDLLSTLYAVLISCLCLVLPSILRHQSNIQRDIIETNTFQLLFSIFAFGDLTSTKLYLFFFSIQEHHKLVKT